MPNLINSNPKLILRYYWPFKSDPPSTWLMLYPQYSENIFWPTAENIIIVGYILISVYCLDKTEFSTYKSLHFTHLLVAHVCVISNLIIQTAVTGNDTQYAACRKYSLTGFMLVLIS